MQFEPPLRKPETLDEAWRLLVELWQQVAALQAENAALRAEIGRLQEQVQELCVRLGQNSSNSSKPPSSDPPHRPPRPQREPSGRHIGGQPGHEGHGRPRRPNEQVDRVVDGKPVSCGQCGALLLGEDPEPARHQVTEVPRVRPEVIEYRRQTLACLACGAATTAPWPAEMPAGQFGPRVQATVAYLTGRLGASQRDTADALDALFQTEVSLGSIPALEQAVSAALAEPVAAAQAYVRQQPVANVDETSWRQGCARAWLWIGVTPLVTVFLLLATRGAAGAKHLLGETFAGIVGSDRWSAYTWLDPLRRQVCWAHLKRDFQALVERGGEAARLGRALLLQVEHLFGLWHQVRDGSLQREAFQAAVEPIRAQVGALLQEGTTLSHARTRRTCANLLKLEPALWTFVWVAGVEPTNNGAERPLRRGVLWRARSFGTQSEAGSRFVERVLTTVTTLRQQQRDVLDYLTEACTASIRGERSPSLLPQPPAVTPAA